MMFKFKKASIIKCILILTKMSMTSTKTTKKIDRGFKTGDIVRDVLSLTWKWNKRMPSPIGALKDVQCVIVIEETIH